MTCRTGQRIRTRAWECRPENGWHTASWETARVAARKRFTLNVENRTRAAGQVFRDHSSWKKEQEEAIECSRERSKLQWLQLCDEEIKARLRILYFAQGGSEALMITPSVYAVLRAELDLTCTSSMLYASAATIATNAGVCRDTVGKVNRMLEDHGILRRKQSGGLNTDPTSKDYGRKTTNVYAFSHQALRRAIGIKCLYKSRYEAPEGLTGTFIAEILFEISEASVRKAGGRGKSWHPYYNGFGFARKAARCGKPQNGSCGKPYTELIPVYKCAAPALISALQPVKSFKNQLQVSSPYLSVPSNGGKRRKNNSSTRQSRSFYSRPADGNADSRQSRLSAREPRLFTPSELPQNLLSNLRQINPERLSWLYAETDEHLAALPASSNYPLAAAYYLQVVLDADKTLLPIDINRSAFAPYATAQQ